MSPRSRSAPTSKVGASVLDALGLPRGTVTLNGQGAEYVCGLCGDSEKFDYAPMHAPPKWCYSDAYGWAHSVEARRATKAAKAGHVQLGLGLER